MPKTKRRPQINISTKPLSDEVYKRCLKKIENRELSEYFNELVLKDIKQEKEISLMEQMYTEIRIMRSEIASLKEQLKYKMVASSEQVEIPEEPKEREEPLTAISNDKVSGKIESSEFEYTF